MELLQAIKRLNSILRARLNFRRRQILCTTLYRIPTQASNFGGPFDQLLLWVIYAFFSRRCLLTFSTKNSKTPTKDGTYLKKVGFWLDLPQFFRIDTWCLILNSHLLFVPLCTGGIQISVYTFSHSTTLFLPWTPETNSGLEDGTSSLSWKFEAHWMRKRFFLISNSLWKENLNALYVVNAHENRSRNWNV